MVAPTSTVFDFNDMHTTLTKCEIFMSRNLTSTLARSLGCRPMDFMCLADVRLETHVCPLQVRHLHLTLVTFASVAAASSAVHSLQSLARTLLGSCSGRRR